MDLSTRMRTEADTRPRVQVQIVTYNSADTLAACLESVVRQNAAARVVVIDNASTDASVDIASCYLNRVELVRMTENVGYTGGHNVGFKLATTSGMDFVLTLNPDTVLKPDYVERVVDQALLDDRCGGVSGKLQRAQTGAPMLDSAGLQMGRLFHVRDRGSEQPDGPLYHSPASTWGVCGAAALYRVAMLSDMMQSDGQVFDERFFIYKEDVDLCWRARRRGWTFQYVPTAVATHRRTWAKHTRVSQVAVSHSFANQIALLIRHAPKWSPYLMLTIGAEITRLFVLVCTRPRAAVVAINLIRRDWRYHWQQRRMLRSHDTVKESALHDLCHPSHV